jgi:hypothetical protein
MDNSNRPAPLALSLARLLADLSNRIDPRRKGQAPGPLTMRDAVAEFAPPSVRPGSPLFEQLFARIMRAPAPALPANVVPFTPAPDSPAAMPATWVRGPHQRLIEVRALTLSEIEALESDIENAYRRVDELAEAPLKWGDTEASRIAEIDLQYRWLEARLLCMATAVAREDMEAWAYADRTIAACAINDLTLSAHGEAAVNAARARAKRALSSPASPQE